VTASGLTRALSWSAASFLGSAGLTVAVSVPLAHLLPPEDFGVVALAAAVLGLVAVVQDLGLSPALVQHQGDPEALAFGVLGVHLGVALVLSAAMALASEPLAAALGMPRAAAIVRGLSPVVLLRGAGLVPRALLQRRIAFRQLAFADVAGLGVRAAVAIPLAWRGVGPWSLVAGDLAAIAVQSGGAWWACGWPGWRPAGLRVLRPLLGFGRPMTLAALAMWSREGLDRLLVGTLLGSAELAYYLFAARLALLPVNGITHVANRVMFPVYASLRGPGVRTAFRRTLTAVAALGVPVCGGLVVVADSLVTVLFGARWAPMVTPLRLLLVSTLVSIVAATTGELFKAVGRPGYMLRTALPHLVLLVVAIVVGSRFGLVGVAAGVAGVRALMGVVGLALAAHVVGLRPSGVLRPLAPALGGMVAMVVATVAARAALHALDLDRPIALLAAQVGFGAVAYVTALQGLAPRTVRSLARGRVVRAVRA